jgi:hypothetical protein
MDAEDACHDGGGFALIDQFHGTATAAFEFRCCSFGSHTCYYTGVQEEE